MWTTFLQQQKAWKFYLKLAVGVVETWGPELGGYNKIWLRYWGKWWRRRRRGGGGRGRKEKGFHLLWGHDNQGGGFRKEGRKGTPAPTRAKSRDRGPKTSQPGQGRAAPPHFHFPSVMICLTRASERVSEARGLAKSGACRKEGRKESK
jgi:hypothetical protein